MNRISVRIRSAAGKSRILLPGAVIILMLLAALAARWAYNYHAALREEINTSVEIYRSASAMLASEGRIKNGLKSARIRLGQMERGLLRAKKPPVGAASLQELFKAMAKRRGITISSARPLSFGKGGAYINIPVEFHFMTGIGELKSLLYDIRSSRLIMGVKYIRIKSADKNKTGKLDTTLRLEGLMKKR